MGCITFSLGDVLHMKTLHTRVRLPLSFELNDTTRLGRASLHLHVTSHNVDLSNGLHVILIVVLGLK